MSATAGDSAAASVFVAVAREDAFEVFTQEIDLWWRHGQKYRIAGKRPGRMSFECKMGGRLFETVDLKSGPKTFVVGTVVAWDPPAHIALEWRNVNFKEHEKTLVEVMFTPKGVGTMVRVQHSGWSSIPEAHPARHGQVGAAFLRQNGSWWGGVLTGYRDHVHRERGDGA
jgi:uncharacterized protein YndB with AHSA1/START domain